MKIEKKVFTEKCDRCGKGVGATKLILWKGRSMISQALFIPKALLNSEATQLAEYKGMDLCSDCMKSLRLWLKPEVKRV